MHSQIKMYKETHRLKSKQGAPSLVNMKAEIQNSRSSRDHSATESKENFLPSNHASVLRNEDAGCIDNVDQAMNIIDKTALTSVDNM